MTITEFLKQESATARLTNGTRWLRWDAKRGEWVVLQKVLGSGNPPPREIYRGRSEEDAVGALEQER